MSTKFSRTFFWSLRVHTGYLTFSLQNPELSISGRKLAFFWKWVISIRHRRENSVDTLKLHLYTFLITLKKHRIRPKLHIYAACCLHSKMKWVLENYLKLPPELSEIAVDREVFRVLLGLLPLRLSPKESRARKWVNEHECVGLIELQFFKVC